MNQNASSRRAKLSLLLDCSERLARSAKNLRSSGPVASGQGKSGILLAAFGTSVSQARIAFGRIDRHFSRRFAGRPLRWAFSSPIIRHKMALERAERGVGPDDASPDALDSLTHALARMLDDGFSRVAVQSLHTIPGFEYEQLQMQVRRFEAIPGAFEKVVVGKPLLYSDEDLDRAARAVVNNVPPRPEGVAAVLMGHGAWHPGGAFYDAVHRRIRALDRGVWVGAMNGALSVEKIREELVEAGVRRVWLAPFMSVAGEHAVNDMAGEDVDSWKSALAEAGIEAEPVMKGTAEFEDYVDIWADHLAEALAELDGGIA